MSNAIIRTAKIGSVIAVDGEPHVVTQTKFGDVVEKTVPVREYYMHILIDQDEPSRTLQMRASDQARLQSLDPLKALLTTWRESIPKHRAEASRLEDEGLSIYSMGESALATGKEKCADELDAALLALGERQETAEPPQDALMTRILVALREYITLSDSPASEPYRVRLRKGLSDLLMEGEAVRKSALAAHREGPATAEKLRAIMANLHKGDGPHCDCGVAETMALIADLESAHREGRPPAAETLEEEDLSR